MHNRVPCHASTKSPSGPLGDLGDDNRCGQRPWDAGLRRTSGWQGRKGKGSGGWLALAAAVSPCSVLAVAGAGFQAPQSPTRARGPQYEAGALQPAVVRAMVSTDGRKVIVISRPLNPLTELSMI